MGGSALLTIAMAAAVVLGGCSWRGDDHFPKVPDAMLVDGGQLPPTDGAAAQAADLAVGADLAEQASSARP